MESIDTLSSFEMIELRLHENMDFYNFNFYKFSQSLERRHHDEL